MFLVRLGADQHEDYVVGLDLPLGLGEPVGYVLEAVVVGGVVEEQGPNRVAVVRARD